MAMATRKIPLTFEYGDAPIGTCEYDDETGVATMTVRDPQVKKMLSGSGGIDIAMGMSVLLPHPPPFEPEAVHVETRPVTHLHTVQFGGSLSDEEIHLEADHEMGTTQCGIELFPRDADGYLIPRGWSRGGGDTGPNCRRVPCPECRDTTHDRFVFVRIEDTTFNLDWSKP
jgi:hypothetical protein